MNAYNRLKLAFSILSWRVGSIEDALRWHRGSGCTGADACVRATGAIDKAVWHVCLTVLPRQLLATLAL